MQKEAMSGPEGEKKSSLFLEPCKHPETGGCKSLRLKITAGGSLVQAKNCTAHSWPDFAVID